MVVYPHTSTLLLQKNSDLLMDFRQHCRFVVKAVVNTELEVLGLHTIIRLDNYFVFQFFSSSVQRLFVVSPPLEISLTKTTPPLQFAE